MRKRTVQINFRLSRDEADALAKRVQKSGLTREGYFRHIIGNLVPAEPPDLDYHDMRQRLGIIGTKLNNITRKANAIGLIDETQYKENIADLDALITEIIDAKM